MDTKNMPAYQLLKGWLFIAVIAVALFFMARVMERRYEKLATNNLEPMTVEDNLSADPETPINSLVRDPIDQDSGVAMTELAGDASGDATNKDQPRNGGETPMLEGEPPEPVADMPSGDSLTPMVEKNEASTAPRDLPEDRSSEKILDGPEATSFEAPKQTPLPLTAGDTISTTKTSPRPADQPSELVLPPFAARCTPFPQSPDTPEHASEVAVDTQMLLWRDRKTQAIAALVAGMIVNISESPFTGTTLYLLSEDGRFCLVYGYLGQLQPEIVNGADVRCGALLANTRADDLQPSLGVKVLTVASGASWWQGKAVDPALVFPELLPPEPEPEEAQDEDP